MAEIDTIAVYPLKATPVGADTLIGSDSAASGATKQFAITGLSAAALASAGLYNVKAPAYGAVGNGVTDDYAAIAAAIAAAGAAGGGVVYFPPGTYLIKTVLSVPNKVWLVGANRYTSILKADTTALGALTLVTFVGVTGAGLRELRLAGPNSGSGQAVAMASATDCAVEDCTIDNKFGLAVLFGGFALPCVNCGMTNSTIEGTTLSEALEFVDSRRCYARNNHIANAVANGIVTYKWTAGEYNVGTEIVGNYVHNCQHGITDGGGTRTAITGNVVADCTGVGIGVQDGSSASFRSTYGTMTANTVNNCNTGDVGQSNINVVGTNWTITANVSTNSAGGAGGTGGNGIEVTGNYNSIVGNTTGLTWTNGLYIAGDRCQVLGNTAIDPSVISIGSRDGMNFYGQKLLVIGNTAHDTRGTKRMRYAYRFDANTLSCTVVGNRGVFGTAGLTISDSGTGNILLGNENGAGGSTSTILPGDFKLSGSKVGFYGTAPAVKPTVTGAKGSNAALASLLTALAGLGLLTDSSSA